MQNYCYYLRYASFSVTFCRFSQIFLFLCLFFINFY